MPARSPQWGIGPGSCRVKDFDAAMVLSPAGEEENTLENRNAYRPFLFYIYLPVGEPEQPSSAQRELSVCWEYLRFHTCSEDFGQPYLAPLANEIRGYSRARKSQKRQICC